MKPKMPWRIENNLILDQNDWVLGSMVKIGDKWSVEILQFDNDMTFTSTNYDCCTGFIMGALALRGATPKFDHEYEPGDYGVCRRCGKEKHN